MLSNLVSNAIKFTDEGSVRIDCREVVRDSNGALLEFAVIDSGMGISEERQHLLFQPFSQADSSITRKWGTGLLVYPSCGVWPGWPAARWCFKQPGSEKRFGFLFVRVSSAPDRNVGVVIFHPLLKKYRFLVT